MSALKVHVWRRLLWDAAFELVTGARSDLCGHSPARNLTCERRALHRGKHAMTKDGLTGVWRG